MLSAKLTDRREGRLTSGKCPALDSVKSQVAQILSRQHVKRLIQTSVVVDSPSGVPVHSHHFDGERYAELTDTYLGNSIIFTDNADWTDEEIVLAYFDQYVIEDAFKQMKDRCTGSWWPMYHWTDRMIKVHGFYCSLSLLLRSLIFRRVKAAGIRISVKQLHQKLNGIREVLNVFPAQQRKRIGERTQSVVSRMDDTQMKLFQLFEMGEYLARQGIRGRLPNTQHISMLGPFVIRNS